MKKLLLTLAYLAASVAVSLGQNPTLVYQTNGVTLVPSTTHAGKVTVGLYTNAVAAGTVYGFNGTTYQWFPTNSFVGAAGITSINANTTAAQLLKTNGVQGTAWSVSSASGTTLFSFPLQGDTAPTLSTTLNANSFNITNAFNYIGNNAKFTNLTTGLMVGNGNGAAGYLGEFVNGANGAQVLIHSTVNSGSAMLALRNDAGSGSECQFQYNGTTHTSPGRLLFYCGGNQEAFQVGGTVWLIGTAAGATNAVNWNFGGNSITNVANLHPVEWTKQHRYMGVTNGNAIAITVDTASVDNSYANQNVSASNDAFFASVLLKKGTYVLTSDYVKSTSSGIVSLTWDGAAIGTIDSYNGTVAYNSRTTGINITNTQDGVHILKGTMATKNASSSGFTWYGVGWSIQ